MKKQEKTPGDLSSTENTRDVEGGYEERIHLLEDQLKNKMQQLEEVSNELEALSFAVSHDLKAPLRAITGFAEILKEEYNPKLDEEGKRVIDIIDANAKKLNQLIDGLLSYSGVGKRAVVFQPVNMKALAENCIDELLTAEQKKHQTICIHDLPVCMGDENLLKQVWINLLGSAIKNALKKMNPYIEAGFEIEEVATVYFVRERGQHRDTVSYDNAFLSQTKQLPESKFDGSIIGLAFIRRIILRHAGSVWVQSTPNEGSTFYFSIPKKASTLQ